MAQTPEAKLKKKIKKLLDAHGVYHFSPIGGPYSSRGVPDIICCADGKFIAIEVKAPGRLYNVTRLQAHNIEQIRKAGGIALVTDSIDHMEVYLRFHGVIKGNVGKANADVAGKANSSRRKRSHSSPGGRRSPGIHEVD